MTANEAAEFAAARNDALNAVGEEQLRSHEAELAMRSSVDQVFDDVRSKAQAAGYTLDAARQYAALYAARYAPPGRSAR